MRGRPFHLVLVMACLLGQFLALAMPRGAALCIGCDRPGPVESSTPVPGRCPCCPSVAKGHETRDSVMAQEQRCSGIVIPSDRERSDCCRLVSLGSDPARADPRPALEPVDLVAPQIPLMWDTGLPSARSAVRADGASADRARKRLTDGLSTVRLLV